MFTKHEQIRAAVRLQKRTKVHQIKDPFGWLRAAPAPAPKSLFIYTYFTVHRSPFSLSSPPHSQTRSQQPEPEIRAPLAPAPAASCRPPSGRHPATVPEPEPAGARPNGSLLLIQREQHMLVLVAIYDAATRNPSCAQMHRILCGARSGKTQVVEGWLTDKYTTLALFAPLKRHG